MKSEAELNVMSTNLSVEVTLLRLVGAGTVVGFGGFHG